MADEWRISVVFSAEADLASVLDELTSGEALAAAGSSSAPGRAEKTLYAYADTEEAAESVRRAIETTARHVGVSPAETRVDCWVPTRGRWMTADELRTTGDEDEEAGAGTGGGWIETLLGGTPPI